MGASNRLKSPPKLNELLPVSLEDTGNPSAFAQNLYLIYTDDRAGV